MHLGNEEEEEEIAFDSTVKMSTVIVPRMSILPNRAESTFPLRKKTF